MIINSWLSKADKQDGNITHARVVTGYNSTGIFCHDPIIEPNHFLNNSQLLELWRTDLDYWALIINQEPLFRLTVHVTDWFENPMPDVELNLNGEINYTSITDKNGFGTFDNLKIAEYTLASSAISQLKIIIAKEKNLEIKLISNEVVNVIIVTIAAISIAIALAILLRGNKKL